MHNKKILDLGKLSRDQRERVNRALNPRDTVFSRRFSGNDIESWTKQAEKEGKNVTEWVEERLNSGVEK